MNTDIAASVAAAPPHHLSQRTRRGLLVFALACAGISGTCWIIAGMTGVDVRSTPASFWLFAVGAAGPSLAALVAVLAVRRSPARRTAVRAPWVWAPLALLLPAIPAAVSQLVLDPSGFGAAATTIVADGGGLLAFVATLLVAGPLAEEFGWRGYVQPRLRLRFSPPATAVIIGLVWSIWHLPLFLLPGTGQHAMGLGSAQSVVFFVSTIPLSMTLLWLTEGIGGGVWAAIVGHFSVNASLTLLPQPTLAASLLSLVTSTAIAGFAWWRMRRTHGHTPSPR